MISFKDFYRKNSNCNMGFNDAKLADRKVGVSRLLVVSVLKILLLKIT